MTLAIDRSSSTRSLIADDPLIAGMSIRQSLPLHESSTRLRELYPECPRAYGVAVMSDVRPSTMVAARAGAQHRSA